MRSRFVLALLVACGIVLAISDQRSGPDPGHSGPARTSVPEPREAEPACDSFPAETAVAASEDVDALPPEIEPFEAPPDPVQEGPCELFLRLVDEETGEPVAASVDLWRLDAPGNESWTRGDQLQTSVEVPVEGRGVPHLPAGAYRAQVDDVRAGGEDPPAFLVSGPGVEVTLALAMPRTFTVRLKIYSEALRLPPEAQRLLLGGYLRFGAQGPPDWVRRRRLRDGRLVPGPVQLGGMSGCGGRTRTQVLGTAEGFEVCTLQESTRRWSERLDFLFECRDRTEVWVAVESDLAEDATFLAVTVPVEWFRTCVRLPDGRRACDAGAELRARCEAIPDMPGPDLPEALPPISVQVALAGYKPLKFTYRLGEALPTRVLRPRRDG